MERSSRRPLPLRLTVIFLGMIFVMGITGCGAEKYKLELESDAFTSKKTQYAEGEKVTVIYDIKYIGTDTDYSFSLDCDDVEFDRDWDSKKGYIITFRMPAHDVKVCVDSRNSMMYDPDAYIAE